MKLVEEYDYRNARAILEASAPQQLADIKSIIEHVDSSLNLVADGKQRNLFFFKVTKDDFQGAGQNVALTLLDLRMGADYSA